MRVPLDGRINDQRPGSSGRAARGLLRVGAIALVCGGFQLNAAVAGAQDQATDALTTPTTPTVTRTVTAPAVTNTVTAPAETTTIQTTVTAVGTTNNSITVQAPKAATTTSGSDGGGPEWWVWVLIGLGAVAAAAAAFAAGRHRPPPADAPLAEFTPPSDQPPPGPSQGPPGPPQGPPPV